MTEPAHSPAPRSFRRPAVHIDRCVCRRRRFAELLPLAGIRARSLAELMRETGCGEQCGLCRPYLARMLATGEVVFRQILEAGPE